MSALTLLVLAGVLFVAQSASTRIVHFGGRAAFVERQGDLEHVVIHDERGEIESDSYCDSSTGTYDQIVSLGRAVVAAARSGNRRAMSALVHYPLRVNVTRASRGTRVVRTLDVKNSSALRSQYATVFLPTVTEQLRELEPHDVFCRNGMAALGGGVMWATVEPRDGLKVAVINQ